MKPLNPGHVVTTKIATRVPKGSRGVVINDLHGDVEIMLDSGPCHLARVEVALSRDQTPPSPPMRFRLPYGIWTRSDAGEVLFNRNYRPLLIRDPGQPARLAAGNEWVDFAEQAWFYDDTNPPWSHRASLRACQEVLEAWGYAGWSGEGLPAAATLRSMEGLVGSPFRRSAGAQEGSHA